MSYQKYVFSDFLPMTGTLATNFESSPGTGLRRFFVPRPLDTVEISISGIGIREWMRPCMIDRPKGTGDCLIMIFHDAAQMGVRPTTTETPEAPGTMIIWPAGVPQHYGNRQQEFTHSWIHCEGRRIKRILKSTGLPVRTPFAVAASLMVQFQQSLNDIHAELVSQARPDAVIAGNLLENGLRAIARSLEAPDTGSWVEQSLLTTHGYIRSHYAEPIDLHRLAALAGMSVPYFCAQFKRAFQVPPITCLIQQRMQHAAHLLADPKRTVAEIAEEVGYDDTFHFSKMFKRHFGLSPRALRKQRYEPKRAQTRP